MVVWSQSALLLEISLETEKKAAHSRGLRKIGSRKKSKISEKYRSEMVSHFQAFSPVDLAMCNGIAPLFPPMTPQYL